MHEAERFRKLAIKRGLTPGAMLEASPQDFDLLLVAIRREFVSGRNYTEREVNDVLKGWLNTTGGMLDVDHVELRRWLIDLAVLTRDLYGQSYSLNVVPQRLQELDARTKDIDFAREFIDASDAESQKRAARKAAWQQSRAGA